MKTFALLIVLMLGMVSQAQTPTPTPTPVIRVIVDAENAFVRAAPSLEAVPVASIFKGDVLEIVSRNLDGSWYEVRRPNRANNLGWIFNNIYEKTTFAAETLPLGDFVTGAIGPNVLTEAPQFGVYMNEGAALRNLPSRLGSVRILDIPPLVTIPVISRTADNAWYKVNYLGYEGWIIAFTTRNSRDASRQLIPIDSIAYTSPEAFNAVIIPPEIQQAQLDSIRAYINEKLVTAGNLEGLWWRVFRGEIMPCDAPDRASYYLYDEQDVKELPELQRVTPRISVAVDSLNVAIAPLVNCGVVLPSDVITARDSAINAKIILNATLITLDNVQEEINEFQGR
jgi:uncharacterized protein YgiM (DUF1202 family)